jgi:hypothetical protein
MTMKFRKQLVTGAARKTYAGTNSRKYITVHETANTSAGADAGAHANLQSSGNVRAASWHWQVDDTEAVQSYEHTARCWHAGDGDGPGNFSSIGVEICVDAGGDFKQAVRNAAELVRRIKAEEPGAELVVQHSHWSGKDCPDRLRSGSHGITWAQFLALVNDPDTNPTKPAPSAPREEYDMDTLDLRNAHKRPVKDDDVGKLQGLLMAAGYGPAGLVSKINGRPDSIGGAATRAALGAFQVKRKTGGENGKADYIAGPATWRELIEG